ncbi:MAG: hypothetical protein JNK74_05275 [Candidatus Hydrogenedentes bacterium]|nr:hypothetical protein [Candidatus Hydrogenedentota bacterium]
MRVTLHLAVLALFSITVPSPAAEPLKAVQITHGPQHHFFGYIGHVGNTPWNGDGRYLVALRTTFQDHMPAPDEAADVVLLDAHDNYSVTKIEETRAWNFQQGTMFYWNPEAPDTQLFFNDRDTETNHVFTVLYDIAERRRIREFRFDDTPFANGGVAQKGGFFLGLNYARLAWLRPVTGYPDAFDWTAGVLHPKDDGLFKVDIQTGEKSLLVSFHQLAEALRPTRPDVKRKALFINHTLNNREGDRVYFYARGDFEVKGERIDVPFTINTDGTGLTLHETHIGGHPEWAEEHTVIGSFDGKQVLYDTDTKSVAGQLGDPGIFPKPGGDVALSPSGEWLVNGARSGPGNTYVFLNRKDGRVLRSGVCPIDNWTEGPLRIDPAPTWNRENNAIAFPALADDAARTRQIFFMAPG